MNKKDLITCRPGAHTDMAFIYRSTLMGTYHGNRPRKGQAVDPKCPVDYFSSINQDTFMEKYHDYLQQLFDRPGTEIKVACLVEEPDVILGFSVFCRGVLHFVFVKPDWRNIGIGRDLCPSDIQSVTGFTRVGDVIRRKKGWVFSPWA